MELLETLDKIVVRPHAAQKKVLESEARFKV
jgi:hypothetical protein